MSYEYVSLDVIDTTCFHESRVCRSRARFSSSWDRIIRLHLLHCYIYCYCSTPVRYSSRVCLLLHCSYHNTRCSTSLHNLLPHERLYLGGSVCIVLYWVYLFHDNCLWDGGCVRAQSFLLIWSRINLFYSGMNPSSINKYPSLVFSCRSHLSGAYRRSSDFFDVVVAPLYIDELYQVLFPVIFHRLRQC